MHALGRKVLIGARHGARDRSAPNVCAIVRALPPPCMSEPRESVTVFLPTWNAGPRLEQVLEAIRGQRTQRRVVLRAIDSGSTDGTHARLARQGVEFEVIRQCDFDHGRTRNRGVLESATELVVLLSQDARPADERWLEEIIAPFDDPRVAGTWARQVPRPRCHPFQRVNLAAHMASAGERRVLEPLSVAEWDALAPADRAARLLFDNVASAVRRSVIAKIPFPASTFGEDMAWARAVLLAGHRLVFAGPAVVEHSHDVTLAEFYGRVVLTHAMRRRLADFEPLPTRKQALVRIGQTTSAFWCAARDARDLPAVKRLRSKALAFPIAALQVAAIRRGARRARYEPPPRSTG